MKSLVRFFLLAVSLSASLDTLAVDGVLWRCWYDQQVHVSCVVAAAPEATTATRQPLPANLPTNLPTIVRVMREDPSVLRNQLIHIPLHTEADDMAFTAVLAKSSVCGSRRDCMVNFSATPPSIEELLALIDLDVFASGGYSVVLALNTASLSSLK